MPVDASDGDGVITTVGIGLTVIATEVEVTEHPATLLTTTV